MLFTLCNSSDFPRLNFSLKAWGGAQDIHTKS